MTQRRAPYHAGKASEHDEQAALIAWADQMVMLGRYPILARLHAIPNGGKRDKVTAVRLKETGVRPGVPDLFIPWPNGKYFGLWIEMKAEGGKLSKVQREWIEYLNEVGYLAVVCYGWESARDEIIRYLEGEA